MRIRTLAGSTNLPNGRPFQGHIFSTLSSPRVGTRGYYREVPSGLSRTSFIAILIGECTRLPSLFLTNSVYEKSETTCPSLVAAEGGVLKEAGFPRTPSGKNFYVAGVRLQNIASTVTYGSIQLSQLLLVPRLRLRGANFVLSRM